MRKLLSRVALLIVGFAVFVSGQPSGRDVRLTLHEGTSMAAAVSPDGRTIAIDLLGALWTLPIEGGVATRILDDGYDARMPAWSPDGRRLAFQAYRSGTWSVWTINVDGSDLRQVTWGPFDDREPHWSADGTRLAFSSDRSGNYDIWVLTLASGELWHATREPSNEFMPAWSPKRDERVGGGTLAFVSDRRDAPGVYRIVFGADVIGEVGEPVSGSVAAPSWSPDGETLAYSVVEGSVSRLVVGGKNIADAAEDVFPFRAQWLSSTELLYTADGKIKRRRAGGGPARTIEFSAGVAFTRRAYTPKRHQFPRPGPQTARGIMHPAVSPDGKQVAFAAVGDLWLASTGGTPSPQRITNDIFVDTDPVWSPDGSALAFSTDRDGTMDVWVRDMRSGRERKIASRGMSAAWSPDGNRIAFLNPDAELHIVDLISGDTRKVHVRLNEPGRPSWSPDGRAIVVGALKPYSTRFREGTNQVLRVSLEGQPDRWFDPVPHKSIGMREDFGPVWSPDGTLMAAIIDGHLATFSVARDGSPIGPPRRLSPELANTPSWTGDSRRLLYQTDDRLKLVDIVDGTTHDIRPSVTWAPKTTTGSMTVHAGRLFDGRSATVQPNVDVVIDGNRIVRVEPHRPDLHAGHVVDATNDTVVPGLIESHSHMAKGYGEVLGRIWLAFGITSVRNPATNPFEGQEDREAIESGVRIGPRVFTTGEPFDGTRIYYPGGTSLDGGAQVAEQLARAEKLGFDFVKTYVRLPDFLQKRIIDEAHRMGMPVTSHELYPAVAYGADGVEHIRGTSRRGYSPKVTALMRSYRDVVDLLAASQMTLTPTIGIQGGHQLLTLRDPSWIEDRRIQRLFPAAAWRNARALIERPRTPPDLAARETLVMPQERTVATIVRAGGRVIAGTDSPIIPFGLALLMELEHYVNGGLTPAEAIRTATAVPADAIGLGAELGTIERGKLADLVVIEGNPLADIKELRRTKRVIKDGVVYEVDALLRSAREASERIFDF